MAHPKTLAPSARGFHRPMAPGDVNMQRIKVIHSLVLNLLVHTSQYEYMMYATGRKCPFKARFYGWFNGPHEYEDAMAKGVTKPGYRLTSIYKSVVIYITICYRNYVPVLFVSL